MTGTAWRVGALVAVTVLVWCAYYGRWTLESWQMPTDYDGDAPEVLAEIQAAAEGDTLPFFPKIIERLGAPLGADWNAYPTPDKVLMLGLGGLSHLVGLFAAANLGMVLSQVLAAVSFYFVALVLRCRWEWAWAGALLFAFAYHTFHRGLAHFSVAISWTVPLGLLAAGLVAKSRRLEWRRPGAWVCLGAAVALGMSNPYNLFFWVQLMGWALVAQWCGQRRRSNLVIGLAAVALAGAVFGAMNLEYWIFVDEPDGVPIVTRNYAGTEIYALKPMEMLVPPIFHRWEAWASLGNRYVASSIWRGEIFFPYLGLVGLAGVVWLAVTTLRRVFRRRPLPAPALAAGWLVAYASVGGLTNLVALVTGIEIFRATNRVAAFISALVLLFLMGRLSRLTWRWPAWARVGLMAAVLTVGLLDQLPLDGSPEQRADIAARVRSDLELGRAMEAALPPGALVFQLPVMGFPEVSPPGKLTDYELFRPYLTTTTLRFSYGAAKFRSRSRWQRDLETVPTATLVERLESYGFAALHVNRRGYPDGAAKLLGELEGLGYTRRLEDRLGHQVAVLLRPVAAPRPPLGRILTLGRGWHPPEEDGWCWAGGEAVLSYYNPYDHPLVVELRMTLRADEEREIRFEQRGGLTQARPVGNQPVEMQVPRLELRPGVNQFRLHCPRVVAPPLPGQPPAHPFALHSSSVHWSSDSRGHP